MVCSFPEDIYLLAECLLQQDDIRLIEKKDYIKNPKPSGYRSLHLIVEVPIFLENEKRPMKVEVQLRTIAMDFWASLEHKLRYKKEIPEAEAVQMAEELTECARRWERSVTGSSVTAKKKTRACRQSDWHGSSIVTKKEPVDKIFQ